MKKAVVLFLAAVMIVMLSACGSSGEADPNAGTYELETIMGMSLSETEELMGRDMSDFLKLQLNDKGKGVITVEGEEYNIKWEVDGTTLTLDDGSETNEGTIENGKISLVFDGNEVTFQKTEETE